MIIKRKIVKVFDDNTDADGWKVKRYSWGQPVCYYGLTHDILEHAYNDKGTYSEEIAAIGRLWAYRHDSPHFLDRYSKESKAGRLGNLIQKNLLIPILENKDQTYLKLPKKLFKQLQKDEQIFNQIVNTAINIFNFEVYAKRFDIHKLREYVIQWFVYGYRSAMKLINKLGYHPGDLWGAVCDTIKQAVGRREKQLTVYIDTDRCYCCVYKSTSELNI